MYDVPHALFQDMVKRSPLSPGHEEELCARIASGDAEARNELALSHMRFGAWEANRWHTRFSHIPYGEFLSAASFGLLGAAGRFDPSRGVKFISYAVWWIRRYILELVAEFGDAIRVPVSQQQSLLKVKQALTAGTLDDLDLAESQIEWVLDGRLARVSLDSIVEFECLNDEENQSSAVYMEETLSYQDELLQDDQLFLEERDEIIDQLLGELDPRRRRIITLYYDFFGFGPKTLDQIADIFGVSRERIRQLKNHGLAYLGHPKREYLLGQVRG